MKKILYLAEDRYGAVSFYRGVGPLSRLPNVELVYPKLDGEGNLDLDWTDVAGCDVAFLPRAVTPDTLRMATWLRSRGLKLWLDLDDSLWDLPITNPVYASYMADPGNLQSLAALVGICDLVTVSTEPIANKLIQWRSGKTVHILPNAYDEHFHPKIDPSAPRSKSIFYRGSQTHFDDIYKLGPSLLEMAKSTPGYKWVFAGLDCTPLTEPLRKVVDVEIWPAQPIMSYFAQLEELQPEFAIIPLFDNSFNRAKSNIAAIEALAVGARVYASALPEFRGLPVLKTMPGEIASGLFSESKVLEQYPTLNKTNQQRLELLETI